MRRTLFTSILAAASLVIILPSLAHAAPPNSLFRQALANQSQFLANQHQFLTNQNSINQQLLANAQRNTSTFLSNRNQFLFAREVNFSRNAPLAQLNRSQALMSISNAARLNQTALSSQAYNTIGVPAFANFYGQFPGLSSGFFNPAGYAAMYGLGFNGMMGASAFSGFPSSGFSGFPSSGFVSPTISPTIAP